MYHFLPDGAFRGRNCQGVESFSPTSQLNVPVWEMEVISDVCVLCGLRATAQSKNSSHSPHIFVDLHFKNWIILCLKIF